MKFDKVGIAATAAIILMTGAVFARPVVNLSTSGYIVRSQAGAVKLEQFSDTVAPRSGDKIEWKVVAQNGSEAAKDFVTNLPVPTNTVYVAESAKAPQGVDVTFSADGGKTFSPKPMHLVKTPAGPVEKPGDPAMYTTVRWTDRLLAKSASVSYTYEAVVK